VLSRTCPSAVGSASGRTGAYVATTGTSTFANLAGPRGQTIPLPISTTEFTNPTGAKLVSSPQITHPTRLAQNRVNTPTRRRSRSGAPGFEGDDERNRGDDAAKDLERRLQTHVGRGWPPRRSVGEPSPAGSRDGDRGGTPPNRDPRVIPRAVVAARRRHDHNRKLPRRVARNLPEPGLANAGRRHQDLRVSGGEGSPWGQGDCMNLSIGATIAAPARRGVRARQTRGEA
jgi:hypothetical protein